MSARLSADATAVKSAIADRISLMVQTFTLLVAAFVISFSLLWKMSLVVLATFPLVVSAAIIEVLKLYNSKSLSFIVSDVDTFAVLGPSKPGYIHDLF